MQRRRQFDSNETQFENNAFHLDHAEPIDVSPSAPVRAAPAAPTLAGPDATWTKSTAAPSDTLLGSQWYVNSGAAPGSAGINVQSVWSEYRGAGIKIAVIDDGFDYNHYDLTKNYNRNADQDLIKYDNDAINETGNNHGTTVMGVIGADDNGVGLVGVAPDASLIGLRIGYGAAGNAYQIMDALHEAAKADVANNSWGYTAMFSDNFNGWMSGVEAELVNAVSTGRGGLGTNVIFAAGNGRASGDDVNYHNHQNSIYTTAVAATDSSGVVASFSNPGAALLVSAPGVGILTTDATNGGYNSGDTVTMNGTSFAAPIVSGVVGLMLEANRNLGYRDVQEILAYSARLTDSTRSSWQLNHSDNWNGGGMHTSSDYGFGLVNAHDAVRIAETWTLRSTYSTMDVASATATPNLTIGSTGTVYSTLNLTRAMDIDKMEVDLNISHDFIGDLRVSLISPKGTESFLIDRPGVARGAAGSGTSMDNIVFSLSSTQFWDESSAGTWTLKVQDVGTGGVSSSNKLVSWTLNAYGDDVTYNDQYVYTDEFAKYGLDASRRTLVDTRGMDTVNASAVTTSVNFDLRTGGTIAGNYVAIQQGTWIERLYGGDANDVLVGNGGGNSIWGGRGNDVLTGGIGQDRFLYGHSSGNDRITDFVASEDKIVMRDGVFLRSTSGSVATLSDGATITAANGYNWKTTDFIYG
ncbi:MAG: S8 family serine peptidase [Alphaproteobacteria bacterium]|nr:S8 family serine peptidase [Alphaproteobacteria bacterium]